MKKIVFVVPSLCAGGAERVLITYANNLDKDKYEKHFIAFDDGALREFINDSVNLHILDTPQLRKGIFKFYKTLKTIQPDVVISTIVHMNALNLLMKPFFPKTQFVVREASLPAILIKEYGVSSRVCRYIYKFLYPRADMVLSPSGVIMRQFEEIIKLKMDNHARLFNPVDTKQILEKIPNDFDLKNKNTIKFISAGRLSHEKGFRRLVQSLGEYDAPPNWRLDILGDGPLRSEIEDLVKQHKLEKHVFLHGYKNNPWGMMAMADCFLLPSHWEGMPNAALESLICGTPVISTREAGGITEIQSLSEDSAVQTADTMDKFMDYMKQVSPQNKSQKAESLLPKDFTRDVVLEKFEDYVHKLCTDPAKCFTDNQNP